MPLDRPPFTKETQLEKGLDGIDTGAEKNSQRLSHGCLDSTSLPGHPRLKLGDAERLTSFLIQETCAPDLETMTPYLWWMTTQSSGNISPLHHQHVKGREIIITEDPRLHLVWIYNRIFIKPIPRYLLSHAFWEHYLDNPDSLLGIHRDIVRRSALGYLRTWSWLITHESDFIMAKDAKLRLVPLDVTWEEFSAFVDQLSNIADEEVSGRYGGYGELRLTRLNFYGKLIMRKWHFQKVHGQYGAYFARFYAPILFFFSVLSLLLNTMQVEMSVEGVVSTQWVAFWDICRWFSMISIVFIVLVSLGLGVLLLAMILDEWIFAFRVRRQKKRKLVVDP
jgi:hypothetical protein